MTSRPILFRNGHLITLEAMGELPTADILVVDGRIAEIGSSLSVPDAETVDCTGLIVMPGLVNAHLHTWQTALRGIGADWTPADYTTQMHQGMGPLFTADDLYWSTLLGAQTQLLNGVTTLVDWCHNNPTPDHASRAIDALEAAGGRAVFMHGAPKPRQRPGKRHFSEIPQSPAEIARLHARTRAGNGLVTLGMAIQGPHYSLYEVTVADLELAGKYDLVASMHVGGPVPITPDGWTRLIADDLVSNRINVVHGQSLTDTEMDRLIERGVTFTPAPEGEMLQGHGFPVIGRVARRGGALSIGTDIESCNGSDMFTSARFGLAATRALDDIASAQRGTVAPAVSVTCRDALEWMTIGGARMLGLDDKIGSLRVGKQADLLALRVSDLNLWPMHDPVRCIVSQAGTCNIAFVAIDGEIVVRQGKLTTRSHVDTAFNAAAVGRRIVAEFAASMQPR